MQVVVVVGFQQVLLLLQQPALVEPAAVEPADQFQLMVQQEQRIPAAVEEVSVVAALLQQAALEDLA